MKAMTVALATAAAAQKRGAGRTAHASESAAA
jgi:hypothetical protein